MAKQMMVYKEDIRREVQKVLMTDGRVNYSFLTDLLDKSIGEMFIDVD